MLTSILGMLWGLLYKICVYLIISVSPIFISIGINFFYYTVIKKKKFPQRILPSQYKKRNIILKLFWDFPKRFVLDMYSQNPDRYKDTGIVIFEGEQGSGKTIASVEYIYNQMKKYPLAEFNSNINVKGQHSMLTGLENIITSDNGIYGQINLIDEIQNWLNSNESKNVPVEFIGEICMQRKQAKQIIGTTQRFNRMSKQLRQETSILIKPFTIMGCLTVCRVYKPNVDADGAVQKARLLKVYCFVHSDELREAYDTYEKVKRLNLKGFKPLSERIGNETTIIQPNAE